MTSEIAHRGPDDATVWANGPVAFGHRRLSIIDVAGGRQPVFNERRDIAVILNGEIYNFAALRDALRGRGHVFASNSDTEAIVHAYEEWGLECITRLEGMFALAVWDIPRQRLLLARDRLGIKPLFICHRPGRFMAFASELRALACDPEIDLTPDPVAIDQYLSLQYVPMPRTGILGIEKLPPAHGMVVEDGRTRQWEYWDPSDVAEATNWNASVDRLRGTVDEAVRSHLVSDVPVGSFLSGGIDSGIVTAVMARGLTEPVRAVTVGFRHGNLDERALAAGVAQRHGCRHVVRLADESPTLTFQRVAAHVDEPHADWSALPTYLVSEAARREVKVILSGDGGDELFGGYARHRVQRLEQILRVVAGRLPASVVRSLVARYPRWMPGHQSMQLLADGQALSIARKHAHGFFGYAAERRSVHGEALRAALSRPGEREELFAAPFERLYGRIAHRDPLTAALYIELKTYLVDDVLTKVDRMSMAHALEVRVPLLDHRLVELALSFPPHWKVGWKAGKRIFRAAHRDLLPAESWRQPKRGFDIPAAEWLRGELREIAADHLLSGAGREHGLVSPEAVERLWREHQMGVRDHARRLWALLMLDVWTRRLAARPERLATTPQPSAYAQVGGR